MNGAQDVLDLELPWTIRPASPASPRRRAVVIALCAGAALVAAAGAGLAYGDRAATALGLSGNAGPAVRLSMDDVRNVEQMTVDDKSQILVEGAEAETRNAAIPVSGLPLEKAASLVIPMTDGPAYTTALRCLTQAVYYEAATEPLEGRRAVAQVVLNRVRHPAYPNSVCGVVYEGSQRSTGCQFSFTCDGSLLRRPMPGPWRAAEAVAKAALGGAVDQGVGTATNYHADYVLPRWAFTLAKIEQVGRHIFYRFNGSWGRRAMFDARYSGSEHIPQIDYAALRQRLFASAGGMEEDKQLVPGLTVTPKVTDRHAENDVGGRLDVTKQWRLSIPDPVNASSQYRSAIAQDAAPAEQAKPDTRLAGIRQPAPAIPGAASGEGQVVQQ
ncbi:cell wall hydrolase [Novosphingobium sp. ZN18A2]|uniref:cell wall hydrolase n=1 Tax=Novosphingobium sp. ZN18A2 TaxID=3079861 RepID=UPI0030D08FDA